MKYYWEQLSPGEREALLRFFVIKQKASAPITAEGVCAALENTHYLSFQSSGQGKSMIQFVTTRPGGRGGASMAEDLDDGIYKAALRAKGVEIEDGLSAALSSAAAALARKATRLPRAGR